MNDIKDQPTPADVSTDAAFKAIVIGASAEGIPALKHILQTFDEGGLAESEQATCLVRVCWRP
jgi:chemotaxis response regulator CheB